MVCASITSKTGKLSKYGPFGAGNSFSELENRHENMTDGVVDARGLWHQMKLGCDHVPAALWLFTLEELQLLHQPHLVNNTRTHNTVGLRKD